MNDDELRQALAALEAYKNQLNALTQQSQLLQMSYEETLTASRTLASLENAKEGDEIMVPVGANSFITVKVTSNRNVIVDIGSDISVEKNPESAIEYMGANIAEISEALKKTMEALSDSQNALNSLTAAIQQEYSARQQKAQ